MKHAVHIYPKPRQMRCPVMLSRRQKNAPSIARRNLPQPPLKRKFQKNPPSNPFKENPLWGVMGVSCFKENPLGAEIPKFRQMRYPVMLSRRQKKIAHDIVAAFKYTPHRRNVNRFRGGLVFKAHRRVYHSTLGWRVIKKKKTPHTLNPKP